MNTYTNTSIFYSYICMNKFNVSFTFTNNIFVLFYSKMVADT